MNNASALRLFLIYVKTSPSVLSARFWDIAWLIIWVVGNDALSSLLSVEAYFRVSKRFFIFLQYWQTCIPGSLLQTELNFNQIEKINQNIVTVILVLILFTWGEGEVFDCWLKCAYASLSQWQDSSCSTNCNFLHSFRKYVFTHLGGFRFVFHDELKLH